MSEDLSEILDPQLGWSDWDAPAVLVRSVFGHTQAFSLVDYLHTHLPVAVLACTDIWFSQSIIDIWFIQGPSVIWFTQSITGLARAALPRGRVRRLSGCSGLCRAAAG